MATIRSRSETNRLFIDFRFRGVRYRQQTTLKDTLSNRQRVKRDMKKIEAKIELGELNIDELFPKTKKNEPSFTCETERFDKFSAQWLEGKRVEWRESHFKQTHSIIKKYLIPCFGVCDVKSITKRQVLKFRSTLAQLPGRAEKSHMSPSRINHIMSVFRMILDDAADVFEFKPAYKNIRAIRIPKTDIKPFNLEEIDIILKSVNSRYQHYLAVRFYSGLRSSEINGLKWKNVDFENRQILVREAWVNGELVDTKNDGSTREVTMSHLLYEALKAQQRVTADSDYVFSNKNHNPIDNGNFTKRIWYPLLERLGLEKRRPYQTRHTTASLWLAAGESVEWIAMQLGHVTVTTLFRVYSRYVPNLAKQDGHLFENTINNFHNRKKEIHHA